jgi:hypothetical protein
MTDRPKSKRKIYFILGGICTILISFLILFGCGGDDISAASVEYSAGIEVIEVEGMTCVVYKQSNSGGITCNWSEWTNKEAQR